MKKVCFFLPIVISLIIMMVIFYFSAQPANESTEMSNPFVYFIMRYFFEDPDDLTSIELIENSKYMEIFQFCQFIVRKFAHFYIYFLLGNHVYLSCKNLKFRLYPVVSAFICLAYASSDEIHQHFVPGRSCELRDVMIDFCGALIPIIILSLIDKKE